jgi:glutathione synthase/RimK-type ligase-like ATP-grasp enzyme
MKPPAYLDDRGKLGDAEVVKIQWPADVRKPVFGIVRDAGPYPRWTKYRRFFENNAFEHDIYDLHAHDWEKKAEAFDIIVGIPSPFSWHIEEMRRKYRFLEGYMGKACYPSPAHADLYEDKILEAYISGRAGLPFADTHISNDEADALRLIKDLVYPVISKITPSSGSMGVELVRTEAAAYRIVKQAFSSRGRGTHTHHFRQKNFVYFQDMVPNDGYDIRCIVVGNQVFGYYRKVLAGDFRASGMNQVEKRELPEPAMRLSLRVNEVVKSPMLVVDMVHGLDDCYYIIEFSPVCQMEFPEQLHVNGVPGVYIFEDDGSFHFEPGKYWVHELALRKFLLDDYLPRHAGADR